MKHFCKGGGGTYVDPNCADCIKRLQNPSDPAYIDVSADPAPPPPPPSATSGEEDSEIVRSSS